MKKIKTVGVVGAGTMGSALAQKFAQEKFNVILADRELRFVERGISSIRQTLSEGIERKIFTAEQVENILSNINGTSELQDLKRCDLIVEAIYENLEAKKNLFADLNNIIEDSTIVATNTSSFSVTELAKAIQHPERFIGLHYFYHAAKNRLVEIVPGEKTSAQTFQAAKIFSVLSGKDAIVTKDAYGFAVNRFFVPWLNESVRLLKEKIANPSEIDALCKKIFGIGMGPFALMNATGIPIAYHAQKTLESFGEFYEVCELLKQKAESNTQWELKDIEASEVENSISEIVKERMLGVTFFVCSQILEEKVCSATDLNKGAKIGLKWKNGPVDLMNRFGEAEVKRISASLLKNYSQTKIPAVDSNTWNLEFVQLENVGKNSIVKVNRPEDLNALNEQVMKQLDENISEALKDKSTETIIIAGNGKAFVAGADIKFFVQNIKSNSIENIVSFTKFGHDVLNKIDNSNKKVVAVLNGLALGGGLELALCADVIIAAQNAVMAFPETGIGIYPGLGGTQRCARRIGKGLAKYLIFTGRMISANEALEIGLIDAAISTEVMIELLEGRISIESIIKSKSDSSEELNNIASFFENNSVENMLTGNFVKGNLSDGQIELVIKLIKRKAPIALKLAEQLIDEAKGTDSELEKLSYIFSTSDALLGLTSIGKKVLFEGK